MMSKFRQGNRAIEKAVVSGYQAIEDGVVTGYKAIESGFVGGYKRVERAFVEAFLAPDAPEQEPDGDAQAQQTDGRGAQA